MTKILLVVSADVIEGPVHLNFKSFILEFNWIGNGIGLSMQMEKSFWGIKYLFSKKLTLVDTFTEHLVAVSERTNDKSPPGDLNIAVGVLSPLLHT